MNYLLKAGRWMVLTGLVLLGLSATPAAAAEDVNKPVQQFQQALLHIMQQGQKLGFDGRRQYLAAVIDQVFDLPRINRAIIGRYWQKLSDSERRHLSERIRSYALATLASRFTEHDGQDFIPGLNIPTGDSAMRIKSRFRGPDTDVSLDYLVHRSSEGDWRITNVWFDGVSGTDIQHMEFASFLRKGGAPRLIAKLDEIIAGLSRDG